MLNMIPEIGKLYKFIPTRRSADNNYRLWGGETWTAGNSTIGSFSAPCILLVLGLPNPSQTPSPTKVLVKDQVGYVFIYLDELQEVDSNNGS